MACSSWRSCSRPGTIRKKLRATLLCWFSSRCCRPSPSEWSSGWTFFAGSLVRCLRGVPPWRFWDWAGYPRRRRLGLAASSDLFWASLCRFAPSRLWPCRALWAFLRVLDVLRGVWVSPGFYVPLDSEALRYIRMATGGFRTARTELGRWELRCQPAQRSFGSVAPVDAGPVQSRFPSWLTSTALAVPSFTPQDSVWPVSAVLSLPARRRFWCFAVECSCVRPHFALEHRHMCL